MLFRSENCTCKACKNNVFHCQICKFVGFLLPSSSWLLKLLITACCTSRHSDKSFSLGSNSEINDDIPCCGETFGAQRISRGAESVANQITQPALGVESKTRLLINWPTLSNFIFNPTTGNLAKALFAKRNRKTLRRSVYDRLLKSIG